MSIAEIKAQHDILAVAEKLGIQVDPKSGKALCPFHNDKNPSLQFSKEKQIATCFSGNCSARTMDVITLVEKKLGVNNIEALKWLNPINKGLGTGEKPQVNKTLLERLVKSSKHAFNTSKQSRAYADFRGLKGELCFLGPEFYRNWGEEEKAKGERIGLLKKYRLNGYSSAFKNRLVFFLRNKNNIPVSIYGRAIEESNTVPHLYLKNGQQGLFPSYPKPGTKQLILTESIIDAQSLVQGLGISEKPLGNTSVLALYGTNGLTKEHAEAASQLKELDEIIFFFDGDEAGNKAIEKYVISLQKLLPSVKLSKVNTPDGEDINSLMVGHEQAGELFTHLLKERRQAPPNPPQEGGLLNAEQSPVLSNEKSTIRGDSGGLNTASPNNLIYQTTNAVYSVKGGINKGWDSLKITLCVELNNCRPGHRARLKLDLYEDKQMVKASREISNKLGLDMATVEMELELLTDELEEYRQGLTSQKALGEKSDKIELNEYERKQGFELLKRKS